ncbi:kynureninase [Serratia microhaemolytica]|uniref:kynureninase n=1 Tax=Serratia microhaemolytica TaxID=2675110 RepID=UPI000FDD04CD|nr:kynureninase [Serratia microhaemolytica]
MLSREFKDGLAFAQEMDQQDVLRPIRDRFYQIPGEMYMDGNSLGLCSKDAEESLISMLEIWKNEGIKLWNHPKHFRYTDVIAKLTAPLLNADPLEIVTVGSTTSNIHQCLATFYHPTEKKYKILVDDLNFPSDRYAVDSMVMLKGLKVEDAVKVVCSRDGRTLSEDDIIEAMTDDVALVHLPSVLYRSSQLVDMEKVSKAARERGIIIGWDLCHSVGSVPHDFKAIEPDYAVWCTYKYLSAGPGAVAGMYINKKYFSTRPGLAGWWGNKDETQFQLSHTFEHQQDATGWQVGSPHFFSMAPLAGSLKIYEEVGMEKIRAKSLHITAYLMYLIDTRLSQYGYSVGNPREDDRRGGHVSLEHDDAYRICIALKNNRIIPDFREPNVIRLAPVALYNSYEEVYQLVNVLEKIAANKEYENFSSARALVV